MSQAIIFSEQFLNDQFFFFVEEPISEPYFSEKEKENLKLQKVIDHSFLTEDISYQSFKKFYDSLGEQEKELHRCYTIEVPEDQSFDEIFPQDIREAIIEKNHNNVEYSIFQDIKDPWFKDQYFFSRTKMEYIWEILEVYTKNQRHINFEEQKIAIIDTGVDFTNKSNELKDQYYPLENQGRKYKGYNAKEKNYTKHVDLHGHGTFIASLINAIANGEKGLGVLPLKEAAKVINIKAFPDGLSSTLCNAIYFAVKRKATVINGSWGPLYHMEEDEILKKAIDFAYNEKVVFVCAAGNHGYDVKGFFPANDKKVITVGASQAENLDYLWEHSNYGEKIDITAPGEYIRSLALNGAQVRNSGTSFSAPLIAGCVAVVLGLYPPIKEKLDKDEFLQALKKLLQDSSIKPIKTDEDYNPDAGLLNAQKLLELAKELACDLDSKYCGNI